MAPTSPGTPPPCHRDLIARGEQGNKIVTGIWTGCDATGMAHSKYHMGSAMGMATLGTPGDKNGQPFQTLRLARPLPVAGAYHQFVILLGEKGCGRSTGSRPSSRSSTTASPAHHLVNQHDRWEHQALGRSDKRPESPIGGSRRSRQVRSVRFLQFTYSSGTSYSSNLIRGLQRKRTPAAFL